MRVDAAWRALTRICRNVPGAIPSNRIISPGPAGYCALMDRQSIAENRVARDARRTELSVPPSKLLTVLPILSYVPENS